MSEHDFYFVLCLFTNQISRAPRTEHDGVLRHGRYARGGSDTRDYRSQPAAARSTDARETRPRTTPTCRARRIRLTSCQTARASAHRAVHLDGPNTKARACPWRLTTSRRWAMTPSNDSIPAEGEAFRQAYVPRRCVLPSYSLVYDFSCQSGVC
jgi:hypothetical protein